MLKTCPVCGKQFQTTYSNKKYCCWECYKTAKAQLRAQYYHSHREKILTQQREDYRRRKAEMDLTVIKTCPVCGKDFVADPKCRVYCSAECRKIHYREYCREYYKNNPFQREYHREYYREYYRKRRKELDNG